MRKTSISNAGSLGVRIVTPKIELSPKRQPPRPTKERDGDLAEQAPPPPGMGKLLDKTV